MTDRHDDTFPDPTRVVRPGEGADQGGGGDLKGRLIDRRYRVERKLGVGGMATVWLARDEKPGMRGRRAAVKVPHAALLAAPQARERFEREVGNLLETKLPGVVRILDVGRLGETPFLVMEYLEGGSLGERLWPVDESGRRTGEIRRQDPQDVLTWLAPLAATLDSLHAEGLVHRDVKPDNVMFDARGYPYLADFGISKALQAGDGTLTGTGAPLGSVRTMAPEQGLGATITGAADQYALAATVYEVLTGRPVFEGDNVLQVLTRKASQAAPPLRDHAPHVPAGAAAAIMRALERDPVRRFGSCTKMAEAFRRGLQQVAPSRSPAASTTREVSASRRAVRWWVVAAGVVLGLAVWIWWGSRGGSPVGATPAGSAVIEPTTADSDPRGLPSAGAGGSSTVAAAITQPAYRAFVAVRDVAVAGIVSGADGGLRVNGTPATVEGGRFHAVVRAEQDGPLLLRVTDEAGTTLSECPVTVDATPPLVQITYPALERFTSPEPVVRVAGRVQEDDLQELTVSGQRITPDADGAFTWPVTLEAGKETTLTFEARDRAGNEALPVTSTLKYEKPAEAWEAPYSAAEAAGRREDWREASRLLEEAVSKGIASGAIAEWLRRGVSDWKELPTLEVTSPTEGARIEGTVVKVSGTLLTKRPSDSLLVNGRVQAVTDGRFDVEFDYREPGDQALEVVVKDGEEERAKATRRFTLTKPAPKVPAWAKVSAEQIALAEKLGVEVAFESRAVPGMRFVLVPGGTFWMGSPGGEKDRGSDETRHRVTLSEPCYVQVTEVTNGQYRLKERGHDSGKYQDKYALNGDEQPVVNVSWTEAAAYAQWLTNQESDRRYALPTEAQWEHACRAGTTGRYSFGDREEDLIRYANFSDKNDPSGPARKDLDDGYSVTAPAGRYLPNKWGLYDMHGNVWEWCQDVYGPYPAGEVTDPSGPPSGDSRVLRGGSWRHDPLFVRSAFRGGVVPEFRYDSFGFRLVSPLPPGAR